MTRVEKLRRKGFDASKYDPSDQSWRVRCSQCEALVINGVPCHELGCPNFVRERERRRA